MRRILLLSVLAASAVLTSACAGLHPTPVGDCVITEMTGHCPFDNTH